MKKSEIKLTVAITNYNQKEYIVEAVESILRQDIGYSYEILIGDDGSDDGSYELIQNKYGQYENIKIYRMLRDTSKKEFSNWRHSRLIWFLFKEARGQYISILDGDDYYCSKDGFKRKIDLLELVENKDCIACASATIFHEMDVDSFHEIPQSLVYKKLSLKQLFFTDNKYYFPAASCVFRSSVLEYADFDTPELNGADQAIMYFILHYGRLYVTPEYDFVYRQLPTSIWHKGNEAEHAIRLAIQFNIARKKYDDFYFRRLWKDRKSLLFVYQNKYSIPKQIDWEMWGGFVEKYDLEIVKWLMGDNNVSFRVKVEMKITMMLLPIMDRPLKERCKYVIESLSFLCRKDIPLTEKKERLRLVISKIKMTFLHNLKR